MQVHRSLDHLPNFRNAVITIGTFDGVHHGHQAIIKSIVEDARSLQGESIIITFHPHPRNIIRPEQTLFCLSTIQEKLELLEKLGVDHVVVVPFSREFSEMSASEYVEDFLLAKFHPKRIVIGYDHKFGRDRSGDIHLLRQLAEAAGVEVAEIGQQQIEDITVSSTRIRKYLQEGDVATAATLLGYQYTFSGVVVRGDGIGRTLGYPTANLLAGDDQKLIPGNGIYVCRVQLPGDVRLYGGMMSIGTRPTFDGQDTRIEVHIFDISKDLYGDRLRVEMLERIRGEEKFASADELMAAMQQDEQASRALLEKIA
ncbi:MAG TPA: bifunctional riboflavin kinase/FAD synthetase [Chitinophagales bacterium]|nr:bifunctional riboflavin kinase/FAD synthetase [Chitinophagales bacterium]